jgi:hypothetical protein
MNIFQEAKELTSWSLSEGATTSSANDVSSKIVEKFENPGSPVWPSKGQQTESHEPQRSFFDEDLALEGENTSEIEHTIADLVFKDGAKESSKESPQTGVLSNDSVSRAGAHSGESPAVMWGLEEEVASETVTSEIDRKIDEALALASRLGSHSQPKSGDFDQLDDLDLPAFLRHGTSEMPK